MVAKVLKRDQLLLPSGKKLLCQASEGLSEQLALKAGLKVKLRGRGGWDIATKEMKTFEVQEILPFRDISLEESLRELGEIIGTSHEQLGPILDSIAEGRAED